MNLSPNFTLDELTFSPTAAQSGIDNEPGTKEITSLTELANHILQPIRDYFMRPVAILSGFRSPALNRAVGGAFNSQHLLGQAADIRIIGIPNNLLWQYIHDNLPYDQLILEHVPAAKPHKGWVHCSYGPMMRKQALSCISRGNYVPGLEYADN